MKITVTVTLEVPGKSIPTETKKAITNNMYDTFEPKGKSSGYTVTALNVDLAEGSK